MKERGPKDLDSNVNRREFIKRIALNSCIASGAAAVGYGFRSTGLESAADSGESVPPPGATAKNDTPENGAGNDRGAEVLAVATSDDPARTTKLAVEALGGMKRFVSPNDCVLIKPNIGWDRRPKFAANTNPDVVAGVASMCLEAGAGKVRVTDSSCNNPARCFDKSGIEKALSGMDVDLFIPTERDYTEVDLKGRVVKTWPYLRAALESDVVINVPIAKHHSSAVLSLGMKNWFGVLGGGKMRGKLHQQMALSIAELAEFVRPALTILDAVRILYRNGPQGGSLMDTKELKTVVASADPVAVDAYSTRFFDLRPEDVPYITIAAEKGLGTSDLDSMEVVHRAG